MKLHVQLLEARSLRPPDRPCYAYVRLKLGSTKCKSSVSQVDTPDPCWFEDFVLNVDDLCAELHVSVWNQDRFTDHSLGCLRLPVDRVLSADRQTISSSWFPLQKRSKKSKTPVTGELRMGFSLAGRTSIARNLVYPSDDSSITSTPDRSSISRASSSDSIPLAEAADHPRNGESNSSTPPLLQRISVLVSNIVSLSLGKTDKKESEEVVEFSSLEESDSAEEDETSVSPAFFDDDGISVPSSMDDLPPPFEGGILLSNKYTVSAKTLNGILFRPGSQFLKDLADFQKTTDLTEGPWRRADGELPRRVVTYIKAASKLVKAVKATEDQAYLRTDDKGFVVTVSASTPDVPYGNYFRVDLQYCIFTASDSLAGQKTSLLRVSWRLHFLSHTMMKGFIENGARQGLEDSYKQFAEVLEKYATPIHESLPITGAQKPDPLHHEDSDIDTLSPKSDWQLAKEYFLNLRVCISVLFLIVILVHIFLSRSCPKSGLEFWKLDFPDTLREFATSAILGIQLEHIFQKARKFLRARLYRGSDHGIKAKGNGWLLCVTLVAGHNLPASSEAGQPDPYIVFTCGGKARTSSVKLQTSNPIWEERFEFDATEEAPSTMNVEVFDFEGPFTEAESLGHAEINFLKQTQEELSDLWVSLEGKNARASGSKVHLRIVLSNTEQADKSAQYIAKVEKEVGRKISRTSLVKNTSFQKLFSLPSEEFLVNDFSCSLKRKFLLQGRLFLSPRVLAFYSNIFGHKTKFILLWEDIDDIKEATPALGSVGILLNPAILVFTKKGRAMDAQHGAKSVDSKGRFKFQFQSFIHFKPALRTMMALWKTRMLSPEKQMEIIDDMDEADDASAMAYRQTDDYEIFLGVDEANLTEVYSTEIPLSIDSMILIYHKENLDEIVAEKSGRLNYSTTPWESMEDGVQQRRVTFKLSNDISLFGTNVTCIQQVTGREDGQAFFIDEVLTLHDVPYGDNFQIRVRRECENVSSSPPVSTCKVFVGVSWQKSTKFQSRISKNIFERYTKHLKETIDISVKEILHHKNDAISSS